MRFEGHPISSSKASALRTSAPSAVRFLSLQGQFDSGAVRINELITLVSIDLGSGPSSACANGVPGGAAVDIALIIQAVNNALDGCQIPAE